MSSARTARSLHATLPIRNGWAGKMLQARVDSRGQDKGQRESIPQAHAGLAVSALVVVGDVRREPLEILS